MKRSELHAKSELVLFVWANRNFQNGGTFLERLSKLLVQVLVTGVVVYLQHQPSPSLLVTS